MRTIVAILIGSLLLTGCYVTIGSYPVQSYATAYPAYVPAPVYVQTVQPVRYYTLYHQQLNPVVYVPTHEHRGVTVVRYVTNQRGYTVRVRYYGGASGCRHAVVMR